MARNGGGSHQTVPVNRMAHPTSGRMMDRRRNNFQATARRGVSAAR